MADMDPTPFEEQLARRLRARAAIEVAPADARQIALDAMSAPRGVRLGGGVILAPHSLRIALLAGLLLVALIGVMLLAGRERGPIVADATTRPTVAPASVDPTPVTADRGLEGTWVASLPEGLSFGDTAGDGHLALVFDANATVANLLVPPEGRIRIASSVDSIGAMLRFTTKSAGDPVVLGGTQLEGCPSGSVGTYAVDRSADGLTLLLRPAAEACAARSAVLERTWARSLAASNGGGPGVVEAFDPLFSVELPAGSYTAETGPGWVTIAQAIPELQLHAFRDPQGYIDPCDVTAGRRVIPPGADAVVDYFRDLEGFAVDDVTELEVDGHRAIRLRTHALVDATCASGQLYEWQPKAETDVGWFLRPGDTDSLVIVELPGATVMFEVLPAPNDVEAEVIDSIRFLDALPGTP
jgi:hypothetical protein